MADHFQLAPTMHPILLTGQTARLYRSITIFYDVVVLSVGPLGLHRHDFGTLTGDLQNQDCAHLEMPKGELGQFRYVPRGRFEVSLQHPSGVSQYQTGNSSGTDRTASWRIPPWAFDTGEPEELQRIAFALSEFLVLESQRPRFDIFPYAPASAIEAHVDYYGIRYSLKRLPEGKKGMVDIWVQGWPAGEPLTGL